MLLLAARCRAPGELRLGVRPFNRNRGSTLPGLLKLVRSIGRRASLAASPRLLKSAVLVIHRVAPSLVGERELRLLPLLVEHGRAALDVGMHYGLYSIFLEDLAGPAHLFGFEPMPDKIPTLRRMFPHSRVHDAALSDLSGRGMISVPYVGRRLKTARATLERLPNTLEKATYTVRTLRLDDLYEAGEIADVGFIKMDVEGHEASVMRGAQRLLAECRPNLVVEIEQRLHAGPIQDVFAALARLGYAIYFLSPRAPAALTPVEEFDLARDQNMALHGTRMYVANFVCLPVGRAQSIVEAAPLVLGLRRAGR